MLGHEQFPERDAEPTPSISLPATVVASHLQACAAELATGMDPVNAAGVGSATELAEVVRHLLDGQRHISNALAGLAGRLHDQHESGALAAVPAIDLDVLTEVLHAAANAVGYSADALAEAGPSLEHLIDFSGGDTRL
ncbi:hypothetical protein [Amycolatopsis nigrescens]|uniref:hypothetical protein n=1 Tax=Amycolatopsis nigrescens TaxID=381445 RepID=UPI00037D2AC0|nr:hypothetical protein [Amycolatopsis nigrescens]